MQDEGMLRVDRTRGCEGWMMRKEPRRGREEETIIKRCIMPAVAVVMMFMVTLKWLYGSGDGEGGTITLQWWW